MKTQIPAIIAIAIQVILWLCCPAKAAENSMFTSWLTYEPTLEDRLRTAAYSGDLDEIASLVAKRAHIDASDIDGWTPLIEAVTSDQPEAVSLLLKLGARVNARGKKTGHTALSWAAVLGYSHIAETLIEAGADVEVRNKKGRTPLMESALRGHEATTQFLLAKGANPNSKDRRGRTALALAAYGGHGEVVSVLLANGAQADGTAKKLLAKAGLDGQQSHRVSSAGPDKVLSGLNASPVNYGKRPHILQMHTSRLDRIRSSHRSSFLRAYSFVSRSLVAGDLGATPGIPKQLEELTAIAGANSAGASRGSDSRDHQSLRHLAEQATSIWEQLQSNHPEAAAALQARMPNLAPSTRR